MTTIPYQKIPDSLPLDKIADVALLRTTIPAQGDITAKALAQMVIVDGVTSRVHCGKLYVNTMRLSEVRFLDSAMLSNDPRDSFDMQPFLDQQVIRGASAVLIKDVAEDCNRVFILTAYHSTVPADITNTYFIFDRLQCPTDDSHLVFDVEGPDQRAYRATRIYWPEPGVHCNPQRFDFCLIELEASAQSRLKSRALPLAEKFPAELGDRSLFGISHPLGIPCKRSDAAILNAKLLGETPRLVCDFASGGSGSPLIHHRDVGPEVVAILTGNARFTKHDRVRREGRWCVRPRLLECDDDAARQPLVSATTIRTIFPKHY